jgi:hypothetical protein
VTARLRLAAALVVAGGALFAAPAHADPYICTIRGCVTQVGEAVCGNEGCGPVARCHYWTDYPLCIY